jgi:hypothetical protein
MVTKPCNVNKEVYRQYMVENVMRAIVKFFPKKQVVPIHIQQDNAKPHISNED